MFPILAPYGIREATEKVKSNVEKPAAMNDDEKLVHYPSTTSYNLFNLVADLLNFAAAHLNVGGRLVFWMPFHRADYKDTLIPRHASLELKANSEQVLSTFISRRLLTFEKILDPPASGDKVEASVSEQYEFDFRNRYPHNLSPIFFRYNSVNDYSIADTLIRQT